MNVILPTKESQPEGSKNTNKRKKIRAEHKTKNAKRRFIMLM